MIILQRKEMLIAYSIARHFHNASTQGQSVVKTNIRPIIFLFNLLSVITSDGVFQLMT